MQGQLDEWIGDLPAEWDAVKTKQLFRILKRQVPHKGQTILSITQQGIRPKNICVNEGQMAGTYDGYQEVFVGDFAMNSMDLLTGWVDQSQYDGLTSPDYRVFAPIEPSCVHSPFYSYVFQSLYTRRVYYKYGQGVSNMGRWRLPAQTFLNFPLPHPAIEEQRIIAKFIESKTSEIDALIEKLSREVELLERYRRELIARTVTRGLDPDAPIKDSGIEWIGEVPEHWAVERLQWHMEQVDMSNTPIISTQVLSLVKDRGVVPYEERGAAGNKAKAELESYKVAPPGTIVMNSMNVIIGSVGISRYFGLVSPVYYVFRNKVGTSLEFLNYVFQTRRFQKELRKYANGILEIRLRVSSNAVLKRMLAFPPFSEQQEIVEFLHARTNEIDSTISNINRQIELLGKYRKQVINDAVTGKARVGGEA
ncbi:EcoKI restriction-modification system protein HsdS [Brevibacterium ravenspurgense]|uniref:EcoKI restriction-modification system protein HsdS n=1 Tax=Brevibacterium ravenspurgense TaxID=479117 RepID=A0A150HAN9_9MICO|nr:restriction endonuclease subunit S [Brevibacterium ravenspurgense]KXZ59193.1 EcoKI restriction-modification system protein HsdS [Brevibacterium ravenspurgense]